MDGLMDVYAVLDLNEPPKKLKSFKSADEFYYYFAPPLPPIIVLFIASKSTHCENFTYDVNLVFDNTVDNKLIGTLSEKQLSLTWNGAWSKKEMECSERILKSDRVLKLVVSNNDERHDDEGFSSQDVDEINNTKATETDELIKTVDIFEEEFKENQKEIKKLHTCLPEKKSIKHFFKSKGNEKENIRKEDKNNIFDFDTLPEKGDKDCIRKSKLAMRTYGKRNSPFTSFSHESKKQCKVTPKANSKISKILKSPNTNTTTPKLSQLFHNHAPSCRWGHVFCSIGDDKAVVLGGQGPCQQMCADSLWLLNIKSGCWTKETTDNPSIDRRVGHSACYDDSAKLLYVYGGSKHKKWYNDVHTLDVNTWTWTKVETIGKAPTRAYHSCSSFYDELLIFGGVFPNPDPKPDGCSNELMIFDKVNKSWYTPIVTGDIPTARSGHSACIIDKKLFIFGGWDAPNCYNDMYMLDLGIMQFSKVACTGQIPSPRTWHSTTILTSCKSVCVYGGYDGEKTLNDVFIFNQSTNVWSTHSDQILACKTGHAAVLKTRQSDEDDKILVFGGGDNKGEFFDELVEVVL